MVTLRASQALTPETLLPFIDWLYSQTQGQPFYLVEMLKELIAREIIFPALQDHGAGGLVLKPEMLAQTPVGELIPQTLRELIRVQLARLSPPAWTLLVTASALEEGLSFEHLCRVAGLDELEGLYTLEELLHSGWLSEEMVLAGSQAFDGYAFPRQMLREVVYQEAGATRRRLVQRRLATIIREGIADDQGENISSAHSTDRPLIDTPEIVGRLDRWSAALRELRCVEMNLMQTSLQQHLFQVAVP